MRRARWDRCCRGIRDDFRSRLGLDCCYTCGVALTSHSHLLTYSICHSTTSLSQCNPRCLNNLIFCHALVQWLSHSSIEQEPYISWLLCHLFISCCTMGAKKKTQIFRHANLLQGTTTGTCTQSQTRSHYLFVQAEHAEIGPRKL